MSADEFQRAMKYGESAMGILKKGTIPPYPQFYELLYTYATGVNPALNDKINALLRESHAPKADLAERLYEEFLRHNDVEERLSNVSEKISDKIEGMHKAIGRAMESANSYNLSLTEATDVLNTDLDKNALQELAVRLLQETRHMQKANKLLKERLNSSKADIEVLQNDLDEVRRESLLDPLTKIFNRKGFDQGLVRAMNDARESGDPLTLIIVDIDHFKSFNDNYGHHTGDQVLRLVASTLRANIKGQDMAARYGGEEFAAILPKTDLEGATTLAEAIRAAIQSKELLKRSTNEKLGRITASFGVALLTRSDTVTTFVERADRGLYAAKHNGRNQVVNERSPLLKKTHDDA